ncbi:MAG: signal peptidase II [Alphaproteobacteria bacterium]|nr:signal peptidase II [Alphaproteobacteria bacterium]
MTMPPAGAVPPRPVRRWPSLLGFAFVFGVDRAHKYFQVDVGAWLPGDRIEITGFFDYVMVWNTGVSYGLLSGLSPLFLAALIGAVMLILVGWWWRTTSAVNRWGLALALGGGLGNLFDRFAYGAVADFFSLHIGGFYWYVFNIADIGIAAGLGLMIFDMVFPRRGTK